MNTPKVSAVSRRQFLSATTLGIAVFQIGPASLARGAQRVISANDKINIAGIGIGGQGGGDIDGIEPWPSPGV